MNPSKAETMANLNSLSYSKTTVKISVFRQ